MGRSWIFLFLIFLATSASAYIKTLTPSGVSVTWHGSARLNLAGNPANRSGIDSKNFYDSIVRGLQRWQGASASSVGFDYWQGTDPSIYETNSDYNGLSSVYFASNSDSSISSNVLGLTQVWYNTDSGQILEADIALNDINYTFTTDPKDTTGSGSNGSSGSTKRVFIENVITHELGHAFGLSHSGGLQSTMLFMESPEQAFLGCDEQAGIRALYGSSLPGGAISGSVISDRTGSALFGAHVVAISRRRGVALATAMTDTSGRFTIDGLEPGDYSLMVEPYYAGASPLPSYYSQLNTHVCSSAQFSRTFLADNSGNLTSVNVRKGQTTTSPSIAALCRSGGAAVVSIPGTSAFASAPTVTKSGSGDFGLVDRHTGGSQYYRVRSVEGSFEAHVLAYSLYAPLAATLRLLDLSGNPVAGAVSTNTVYTGTSGYVNRDAAVVASSLPSSDYFLEVSTTSLASNRFPAGSISLDTGSFLIITGGVNQASPSAAFPFNARCRMDENFAAYASPAGLPPRFVAKDELEEDKTGFCAQIQNRRGGSSGSGGSGGGSGPTSGALIGWCLPWMLMLAYIRLFRKWGLRSLQATANLV